MQTVCDGCDKPVKKVGRLTKMTKRGLSQMLCRSCKRKVKMRVS